MKLSLFSDLWFIYNKLRDLNLKQDIAEQAKFKFKMNMCGNIKKDKSCFPMHSSRRRMKGSTCLFRKGKQAAGKGRICFLDYSVLHMPGVHKQLLFSCFPTQTSLALCFQTNHLQHFATGCSCLLNEGGFNL